jgi:hypothetical protein
MWGTGWMANVHRAWGDPITRGAACQTAAAGDNEFPQVSIRPTCRNRAFNMVGSFCELSTGFLPLVGIACWQHGALRPHMALYRTVVQPLTTLNEN